MTAIAVPADAATVVLVRGHEHGPWQCYMVKRHGRSSFAACVYVFPGGKVEPEDRGEDLLHVVHGLEATAVPERGVVVAGFRELFEEAGILPAREPGGDPAVLSSADRATLERARAAMQSGAIGLADLLREQGRHLCAADLHPFSRWITPTSLPRRFDTRFFVACCPAGQEPTYDAQETTDGLWIEPAQALARFRTGTFPLVFATEKHLERLALYETIDSLLQSVTPEDLEAVIPQIVTVDGVQRILLPGDPDYRVARE